MATAALLNSLATREQLVRPPTVADGVPPEMEYDLRIWGSVFVEQCGTLLKLCVDGPGAVRGRGGGANGLNGQSGVG